MRVHWTEAEQQAVAAEGVRLWLAGEVTTKKDALARAQSILPKARRRTIYNPFKLPWFGAALEAAAKPAKAAKGKKQQPAEVEPAAAAESASEAATTQRKVFWTKDEKAAICAEAARLLIDLEAGSPRDAMEKAQLQALPPERRRKIGAMSLLESWYPDGLKKARADVLRQRERAAKAEAKAAQKAVAETTSAQVVEVAPVATAIAPAPTTSLASVFGDWTRIREHIVNEIANMVTEGIQRGLANGLANVQLTPPAQAEDNGARAPHVPFVAERAKDRPPSILVVGLKGANVSQIKADFGDKLDLRFCDVDQSKDHLRSMTEKADTTVAVVDFLSHSHTDIIKARSRHFIESTGGMTHLRQELARLAGMHLNGSGAVAH